MKSFNAIQVWPAGAFGVAIGPPEVHLNVFGKGHVIIPPPAPEELLLLAAELLAATLLAATLLAAALEALLVAGAPPLPVVPTLELGPLDVLAPPVPEVVALVDVPGPVAVAVDVDAPPIPAALLVPVALLAPVVVVVVVPVVTPVVAPVAPVLVTPLVAPTLLFVALVLVPAAWLEPTLVEGPCAGSVWDVPVSTPLSAPEHPSPNESSSGVSM